MQISTSTKTLNLSSPLVMGILNTTPDSFSDGGSYTTLSKALEQAERMISAGVSIIDIGGGIDSTRSSKRFPARRVISSDPHYFCDS